jgi:hypothetical protein
LALDKKYEELEKRKRERIRIKRRVIIRIIITR